MDKGFQLMIPREKEETKAYLFDYGIRFSLFGKEFNLSFKVNRKE